MSHFGPIDVAILLTYIVGCFIAGLLVQRHARHLDSFIVAGRGVNVYLGVASLAATEFGLVTAMYAGQVGYTSGFSGIAVGVIGSATMLFMGKSGFVVKRLRASGATTVPEVLERRYGPRVRWWAALFVAAGGILNMGVFLRVGGEFVVTFAGISGDSLNVGGFQFGYLELIMTSLLVLVLIYTMAGGMLSVLVTDLIQFMVMGAGLVLATVLAVNHVGWDTMVGRVTAVHGEGGLDPFRNASMGPAYLVFMLLLSFAGQSTWQTTVARVFASKDEATAAKVYAWTSLYFVGRFALPIVWGVLALVLLDPTRFPQGDSARTLSAMPTALAMIIPTGLAGMMLASMLAAEMSTDSSYLLTWATVIVHDLVKPKCRNGLSPGAELLLTRAVILLIGIFLLFFGLWFRIPGRVFEYLAVTGSIYLSSLSTLLVSALYWKRGTRRGAYCALFLGSACPIGCLVYNQLCQSGVFAAAGRVPDHWAGLASFLLAALGMILGSLSSREAAR